MSSFAPPELPGPGRTHPNGQAFRTLWRSDPGLIVEVRKKVVRMRTHEHVHDPVAGIPTQETRPGGGHDPDPPRDRGLTIAVVIATVTAMVLVVITGAAMIDQRNQIADRDAAVAAALVQRDRAQASVVALTQRIEVLQAQAATAATGKQALTRRLAAAQAQLQRMLGPALPDGEYLGALIAVGADQDPPRLLIDVEQWFTDDAATQAAIDDGTLQPGAGFVPNGYYIRNVDPRWRMLPVASDAPVSLVTYPFGSIEEPLVVGFVRFDDMFERDAHSVRAFPYWITVRDGEVIAIDQQYIP